METSEGTRRQFLKQAACSAVGYSAILSTVFDLFKVNAAAQVGGDYKALVCLFLYGGNDSNNLIVPRGAEYGAYAAARGSLALPLDQVLPITPLNSDGREWALHPSCLELQALFGQGALALTCNVGPLMAPTTREQYQAGTVEVPPSLFSHDDQQHLWQTSVNEPSVQTGWGGRTGDLVRSLNTNPAVSMMISLAGANIYQVGRDVFQYQVSSNGAAGIESYKLAPDPDPESRALDRILAREYSNIFENAYRDTVKKALDGDLRFRAAVDTAPPLVTQFPDTGLGRQLETIAKLIAVRAQLGHQRQIFFCATGGFDTHGDQLGTHAGLLQSVSQAMGAFYAASAELGVASNVTTFTASDFNRTFQSNGSGSDHAWGAHHLVMGGAVQGARLYGQMPALVLDGPNDTSDGRWIPTTAVDQYAATLASWFGVSATNLPLVLPNIARFSPATLGFLG